MGEHARLVMWRSKTREGGGEAKGGVSTPSEGRQRPARGLEIERGATQAPFKLSGARLSSRGAC